MRKTIFLILAVLLLTLTACGQSDPAQDDKLHIVTTIFPEYDWVLNILGDQSEDVEVTLLLDNGVDLHSYQPAVDDIVKISTCDVFIYVGGESDQWVNDALKEATNKDMITVNLLESLGTAARKEEALEGMETEEDPGYDEHVWLSLKNAAVLCDAITSALITADPQHAETYTANNKSYITKLNNMDKEYETIVAQSNRKTLLFCDRFPFRYLMADYGLSCYAAFPGCSSETQASFETVTFLAGKVDELNLPCVLTLEKSDQKIAATVVNATAAKSARILTMDSMQSAAGASYLSTMENNLKVLKEALQ